MKIVILFLLYFTMAQVINPKEAAEEKREIVLIVVLVVVSLKCEFVGSARLLGIE